MSAQTPQNLKSRRGSKGGTLKDIRLISRRRLFISASSVSLMQREILPAAVA